VTLFRHLVQTETVGSIDGEVSEGENEPPAPAGKAAQYQKLSNENVGLGRESKTLKTAPRLPEQGQSRETQDLQVRRDDLAKAMETMAANANGDQKGHAAALCEPGEQPSAGETRRRVDVEGRAIQGIGSTPRSALPSKNHHTRFSVEPSGILTDEVQKC
jgi:hypothetical protein